MPYMVHNKTSKKTTMTYMFNFQELIPLFITSPRTPSHFSTPQKELPLVALLGQEKLAFGAPGFPLQSGLGQ